MKRYDVEMNGDDMLIEEEPDGDWVKADEALARVRELEADVTRNGNTAHRNLTRALAAEQKLAAANALLSDALDALNQDAWPVLADGIRAHLAGQPAAPVETGLPWESLDGVGGRCVKCWCDECQCVPAAPKCEVCGTIRNLHKSDHAGWLCADPACQSAAPSRAEAENHQDADPDVLAKRGLASLRALDALGRIPEQAVKAWLLGEAGPEIEELGRAELARRGLK